MIIAAGVFAPICGQLVDKFSLKNLIEKLKTPINKVAIHFLFIECFSYAYVACKKTKDDWCKYESESEVD